MALTGWALETSGVAIFRGNDKSKRVQEKCGFKFHHTEKDKPWPLMGDIRTEQITCLTRQQWRHVK